MTALQVSKDVADETRRHNLVVEDYESALKAAQTKRELEAAKEQYFAAKSAQRDWEVRDWKTADSPAAEAAYDLMWGEGDKNKKGLFNFVSDLFKIGAK